MVRPDGAAVWLTLAADMVTSLALLMGIGAMKALAHATDTAKTTARILSSTWGYGTQTTDKRRQTPDY
jgi:hypothetical protein